MRGRGIFNLEHSNLTIKLNIPNKVSQTIKMDNLKFQLSNPKIRYGSQSFLNCQNGLRKSNLFFYLIL